VALTHTGAADSWEPNGPGRPRSWSSLGARVHLPRLISWILIGSALSLLAYVGTNMAYTRSSQADLAGAWERAHPQGGADAVKPAAATFARPRVADGQPVARMRVPSIGLSGIVLEGTDGRVLSAGPGHMRNTAYPGEPGNVVISDPDSFSMSWSSLKTGQEVLLDSDYGTYTYRVTGVQVVGAGDKKITASTSKPTLTFLTCYPLWAGSLAPQRYAVLAELAT
jgi:sortase A